MRTDTELRAIRSNLMSKLGLEEKDMFNFPPAKNLFKSNKAHVAVNLLIIINWVLGEE